MVVLDPVERFERFHRRGIGRSRFIRRVGLTEQGIAFLDIGIGAHRIEGRMARSAAAIASAS